ncbi:uncharacterized protein LOC100198447 isoform X1 [Hydra vulgaris]|uniref:uncharacterized protein LOC100198447 isoform X1 n=1 Tax=Hydra vulgaris TaxID=6087 RepID=UPI0001923D6C|nr:probable prolyl 4-hydroxylase 10 [Hydra vulgaris]
MANIRKKKSQKVKDEEKIPTCIQFKWFYFCLIGLAAFGMSRFFMTNNSGLVHNQPSSVTNNSTPKSSNLLKQIQMRSLEVDGRNLTPREVQSNNNKVKVFIVDNFLSNLECDGISSVHLKVIKSAEAFPPIFCFSGISSFRKYLHDSGYKARVSENDFTEGTTCINETFSENIRRKFKYSYSTSFYNGESEFSHSLQKRLESVSNLLQTHGGKYQVTSYPEGVGYKSHTDCSLDSKLLNDRYATILIYLQDVKEGGETVFSKLGIKIKPKKGSLVIWNNMDDLGNCLLLSTHEASKVIKGKKYILQRWYYYKRFESLGLRLPEPRLPNRKIGQPRITCDHYEEGSCRWYDEWDYQHLIQHPKI